MTKQEREKCEKVLSEAIRDAGEANELYEQDSIKNDNRKCVYATIELRKADQKIGYAQGICQALASIGYKSKNMDKLFELIK